MCQPHREELLPLRHIGVLTLSVGHIAAETVEHGAHLLHRLGGRDNVHARRPKRSHGRNAEQHSSRDGTGPFEMAEMIRCVLGCCDLPYRDPHATVGPA